MLGFVATSATVLRRAGSRVCRAALTFVAASGLTCATAAAVEFKIVEGADPAMTIVEISGKIERGDSRLVEQFIRNLPSSRPIGVNLNSPGGSVGDGLQMGQFFHANKIATYVRGPRALCASSCALAFLGGRDASGAAYRVKGSEARLGYHNFRNERPDQEYTVNDMRVATAYTQNVLLAITEYLLAVNADIAFMAMMLEAPAESMTWVANDKALVTGVHVLDEKSGRLTPPAEKAPAGVRTR